MLAKRFLTKLTATEILYVLHIDKPMPSQQAPASVSHQGHSLPMSYSFDIELPSKLRIEQTGDSQTPYLGLLLLSAWNIHRQCLLLLTYKAIFLGGPVPPRHLYPLSMLSHLLGLRCPLMETPSTRSMVPAQVIASKDRCEEGNESLLVMCAFIWGKVRGRFFHLDPLVYSTGFNISYNIFPTRYLIWGGQEY